MKRILHIGEIDKFTAPLFSLLYKNFDISNHRFLCRLWHVEWPEECNSILLKHRNIAWFISFFTEAYKADKIIIHGLFDPRVILFLFFQPWLLRKCYWIIWGGDLYAYQAEERSISIKIKEFMRKSLIKNFAYLVTYLHGDVDLARQWYSAKGEHIECIMYPSNLYHEFDLANNTKEQLNIQIGNSACSENNHIEVLDKLAELNRSDFDIFVPLGYGEKEYADIVVEKGYALFGERFKPMLDFLPLDKYIEHLNKIDIAIFNHNRQQGMGNLISLLGLGKKVFIRPDLSPWMSFESMGMHIYSINDLNLDPQTDAEINENINVVKTFFSEARLVSQLKALFI